MFGDEPYGNYNRIMLSHVLSGEETDADIFLNTLTGTRRTASRCTPAAEGQPGSTGYAKLVHAVERLGRPLRHPHDVLIIATGSNSFMPRWRAANGRVARRDSSQASSRSARSTTPRHDPVRPAGAPARAVVIGGGLLGLEAARGLQTHRLQVDLRARRRRT